MLTAYLAVPLPPYPDEQSSKSFLLIPACLHATKTVSSCNEYFVAAENDIIHCDCKTNCGSKMIHDG